jgi:hypothetical protein
MPPPAYILVLRVWQEPDGRWVARLRGQTEPDAEPSFDRAVGAAGVATAVDDWLGLVTRR